MTQIVKKDHTWITPFTKLRSTQREVESTILSCLCREVCFVAYFEEIKAISEVEIKHVASLVNLPYKFVRLTITRFLVNLVYFRRFLRSYKFTYSYTKSLRKLIIYLHKLHRLAPVFDYRRARENARILKNILEKYNFLPQFATQLAVVLFATDINDQMVEKNIIQANLRLLCNCSAYAFHRTRNKIGLK
ncbi:MAG: hypothetical protein ACFFA0_05115 [Promethearchaeota archaeon]